MSPASVELGVEELSFYYEEMLRSNLVELEVEIPGVSRPRQPLPNGRSVFLAFRADKASGVPS